ncbi:hypothetical protein BJY04DRAFT_40683 [Aspergillus karnatakaensis]|uniref:uncharacterized protein n=1 Tax=Aspergillus karnatakaensis TaxID=1810916 RepID=UPI003CCD4219
MLDVTSLYLKPGLDLAKPLDNANYSAIIHALTRQPGFKTLWEARSEWNHEFVVWLIDRNRLTDHEDFMANKEEYAQMVNPLLEMGATERDDFIQVRHLPPSSSFLNMSLSDPVTERIVTILWLRTSERSSLGRFVEVVQDAQDKLRGRRCLVAVGVPVEQAGECILFIHAAESGQLVGPEDINGLFGDAVDIIARGAFNLTSHS